MKSKQERLIAIIEREIPQPYSSWFIERTDTNPDKDKYTIVNFSASDSGGENTIAQVFDHFVSLGMQAVNNSNASDTTICIYKVLQAGSKGT